MKVKKLLMLAIITGLVASGQVAGAKSKPMINGVVNINTASAGELMLLPGIGKSKAQAIIDYRQNTPFKSAEELVKVRGIGEKLYASLKPHVTTSAPTTAVVPSAKPGSKSTPSGRGKAK